ncbi:MAG: hypothetical protein QM784_37295 [Polyangiaceae bacterium]
MSAELPSTEPSTNTWRSVAEAEPSVRENAPQEPTTAIVHDPYLGREIDLSTPLPPHFASTSKSRSEHALSRKLVQTVANGLRHAHFTQEIRTECPVEQEGDVIIEGRAIVRDANGRVRAYAESAGTGDSAGTWKLYYDDASRLRVAVFRWASHAGNASLALLEFAGEGNLIRCSTTPDAEPPWPCTHTDDATGNLDSAVAAAVSPPPRVVPEGTVPISAPIRWAMTLDPIAKFTACKTVYTPKL